MDVKESALANYPEQQPKQYSKALINEEEFLVKAELDFAPLLKDVAILAGNAALDLIEQEQMYYAFDYEKRIRQNVLKFTQSMLQTEQDKMVEIIRQGIDEGLSIPHIRRNMESSFNELSKVQSERIARTETARASNEAALDAWIKSGVVEGKQWFTAQDDRVDEDCAEMDGKIVWELSGDFYAKESEFENGDPPLHVNCRCVLLPIVDKEKSIDIESIRKIEELEKQVDRRTKQYRDLKASELEKDEYIAELEKLAGV
jgi:SPP1 gp7 family putative phage head morphogenesis protein